MLLLALFLTLLGLNVWLIAHWAMEPQFVAKAKQMAEAVGVDADMLDEGSWHTSSEWGATTVEWSLPSVKDGVATFTFRGGPFRKDLSRIVFNYEWLSMVGSITVPSKDEAVRLARIHFGSTEPIEKWRESNNEKETYWFRGKSDRPYLRVLIMRDIKLVNVFAYKRVDDSTRSHLDNLVRF